MKIDGPVIEEVYETAKVVYLGKKSMKVAVNELVKKGIMNSSSARDTIYNLGHMLRGEKYERTNNAETTEYFLEHIQKDFGLVTLDKALTAVDQHIAYYEQLTKSRMHTLRVILNKYRTIAKNTEIPISEMPTEKELMDYAAYKEGEAKQITQTVRERCGALIAKARSYYRHEDGKLYCEACDWKKPSENLKGDIVEIHHLNAVANMPPKGIQISFQDAITCLVPLCPNCHRMAHSKLEGGVFTLNELKKIINS